MNFSGVNQISLFVLCFLAVGCGVESKMVTVPAAGSRMTGHVHGGQQPVSGSKVYLYAVSTTATAGPATSILNAPGYVTTGADGSFSIDSDYTCPADAYVYLLALGGNPGLGSNGSNPDIALAAGVGPCSALTSSSYFTINEVTTVALAYVVAGDATSDTNIGASGADALAPNFAELLTFIDPSAGTALTSNPGGGTPGGTPAGDSGGGDLDPTKLNALANSLAACINSSGVGDPCASLLEDTTVTPGGRASPEASVTGGPTDTFQAAISVAQHPSSNVAAIYQLGAANGPFQPTPEAVPSDWTLPIPNFAPSTDKSAPTPSFFNGQVDQGNGVEYLAFSDSFYFGYYSFLTSPNYLYHEDMGYEYFSDANDGQSGLYLYDFMSGHTWYTSPSLLPYIYDYNLSTFIYYFVDTTRPGHYTTNPRDFYNFNTSKYFTM